MQFYYSYYPSLHTCSHHSTHINTTQVRTNKELAITTEDLEAEKVHWMYTQLSQYLPLMGRPARCSIPTCWSTDTQISHQCATLTLTSHPPASLIQERLALTHSELAATTKDLREEKVWEVDRHTSMGIH